MLAKLWRLGIAVVALGAFAVPGALGHDNLNCPGGGPICVGDHFRLQAFYITAENLSVTVTVEDDGLATVTRTVRTPQGGSTTVSATGPLENADVAVDWAAGSGHARGNLKPTEAQDPQHLITDFHVGLEWTGGTGSPTGLPTCASTVPVCTATACGNNRGVGFGESKSAVVAGTAWGAATPTPAIGQPIYRFTCVFAK